MNKFKKLMKKGYSKYISIPIAARAALWFVACTMLQKCIGFITVPIFTRLMPTEEYGLYNTYLSWYSILTVFCTLNMHNCIYINRYTKADTLREKNAVSVPLLSLSEVLTIGVFIVYVIFHNQLDCIIGLPFPMVCLLFAQIFFEPPVHFWSIKQRFEYRYVVLVIVTILMVILNSVLGIVFVYFSTTNESMARVFSVVLVQIIFGGIFYFYFFLRAKKLFSFKGWLQALKVQLPLLPHGLSLTILGSSDKIMISAMRSPAESAVYSVAYTAGYIVSIIKSSIVDAMRPWMYKKIKEKDYNSIRKNVNTIMIIITLLSVLFTAFAPEIVYIMAPSQYHEAVYVIPPVAASSFFTFLYNMFSIVGMYFEKTTKIMFASVSGAIMNLILNFIFIPIYGYMAAAYTTLVCYIFFTFAHYIIMRSICKQHLDDVKLFDMKFIYIISVLVIAIMIIFEFTYKYVFVRYGIILAIVIILFVKRNTFINTIKEFKKKKQ